MQTDRKKSHTGETKSDNMLSPFILTMVAQNLTVYDKTCPYVLPLFHKDNEVLAIRNLTLGLTH